MSQTDQSEIVRPDPARMIEGLRDTGYDFNTALADIIDNSIAANASIVDILVRMDYSGGISVSIADNGTGMDRSELVNAMKYGSLRRPDAASLGKFGLGLKTASTAFCRKLCVVSRPSGTQPILQAVWDLDHVEKVEEWELLFPESPNESAVNHLNSVAPDNSGTVVVWEKVDRLLKKDYQSPGGTRARNALKKTTDNLRAHLAMVYQRFLDTNDRRARTLKIRLDEKEIEAWDPFCAGKSDLVAEETVPVELSAGRTATFTVKAYILPRKDEFMNPDEEKMARLENDRQGIYIYRQERLIHDADWLGIFQKEPHGTLLRVEFSFDHHLDEAFHIDIKKSRIILNEVLWTWLAEQFLPAPRRAADDRYRKGVRKKDHELAGSAHDSSNVYIGRQEGNLDIAHVEVINQNTGSVQVTNPAGTFQIKLKIEHPDKPGQCFVQPVESIEDGLLWEPALIDGHQAVRINTGHPYYHKVYVPNLQRGVTVQGIDSLMWAMCAAELSTINDDTKRHFNELRFEVSRLLRRLVEGLPDPGANNGNDTD